MGFLCHAYYLRSAFQEAGVDLLSRSGEGGYAWPSANGWVPLVVRGRSRDQALLSALGDAEALLGFTAVEDRGWSFELCGRDKCFLRYSCLWSPSLKVDHELVEKNERLLLSLMAEHNPRRCAGKQEEELRSLLRPVLFPAGDVRAVAAFRPHARFAALLGLSPAEDLFYDELPSDILERVPGLVRVSAEGLRAARRSGAPDGR